MIHTDRFYFRKSLIVLIFSLLAGFSQANNIEKKVRFQSLSVTEGLCHPFVYNITQDKNGFLWIGTGEGLCRYDGIDFISSATLDSLPIDVVNVSFRDNLGKLWFGYNNGQVWSYDGLKFSQHPFPEEISTSITGFAQSENDGILVATQNNGIFYFNEAGSLVPYTDSYQDKLISAIHIDAENLLVGTQEGLMIKNTAKTSDPGKMVPELEYIKVQTILNATQLNSYWVGTEDAGIFYVKVSEDGFEVSQPDEKFKIQWENIQDLKYDTDSNLIACSYTSGLLRLKLDNSSRPTISSVSQFNTKSGLSTNYIKCAYLDHENNIWLGTYGNGLLLKTNQAFGFFDYSETDFGSSVNSIAVSDSLMWLGGNRGILEVNQRLNTSRYISGANLPSDVITCMVQMKNNLWVGTASNGIYTRSAGSKSFRQYFKAENSIGNSINHLIGDGENLYVATKDGIYIINTISGEKYHYSTINGLPHNDIEYLFLDAENQLLFATRANGIYQINVRGEVEEYFTVGKYELDFNSITQDTQGNTWLSTYGQGVFLLMKDSVVNLTAKNGLKSNYCYSITSDDSMYVWVGHRLGMSRIDIQNLAVAVFDSDNGISGDCNQNATALDNQTLYFGTTEGLVTYDISTGYSTKKAPLTNILDVYVSDKPYNFRTPIVLPFDAYKLRIDYIGLNYSDPDAVQYRYKLEGYDLDWSELTDLRTVVYPRVEDGDYIFKVKAIGPNGVENEVPTQFKIKVKLPVWKTWWFITLSTAILILLVIVIIKYRERKQKQIQEYLEQRLDERTREVVEQKEEIEVKNRDITDSINYAQRIQTSILPPVKRLQQYFDGSFIFYQPRDIVSGDFYWFDKIDEDRFVIVCSDSTGHGVPGAFMSMIGTTLIKDVSMRPDVNSPAEILRALDEELRNTLNQNVDAEQSNDGMDIIVCEVNVRTQYLRFSSAMRPMIVYRNGEQVYIKGSRNAVGGQYDKDEKQFKDEGMQLNKGDIIYMFSDGYPDQFGGSVGKKFKMVRLKNLLRDIHQKPMEEQYEYVKSTFNLWKEDFDQVDDVLFMGIKL